MPFFSKCPSEKLWDAVHAQDLPKVKQRLESPNDININYSHPTHQNTILHQAVFSNHLALVKLLLMSKYRTSINFNIKGNYYVGNDEIWSATPIAFAHELHYYDIESTWGVTQF